MRKLARLLGVAAVLVSASWSSPALASCIQQTVSEQAARAEVIVYGTVTETRQTFAPASGVIRFRPERFLKGTLPGEVEVYLGPTKGGALTSVDYQVARSGEAHTLYLREAGGNAWQTDACSGSHTGSPTSEETTIFGAGSVAPPVATQDATWVTAAAIATALIAVLAIAVVVWRRYAGPSTLKTTSP